jgi:hypothetical protein
MDDRKNQEVVRRESEATISGRWVRGERPTDDCLAAIVAVMRLYARYDVAPSYVDLPVMARDLLEAAGKEGEFSHYDECLRYLQHGGNIVRLSAWDWEPLAWRDAEQVDTQGWPDTTAKIVFEETPEKLTPGERDSSMNARKIGKSFDEGSPVNPLHLLGEQGVPSEWAVRMLTGPVLDLGFLHHRKRFWLRGGRVVGCNILGKDFRWGFFTVEEGDSSTSIDYGDERNGLSHLISDEVRLPGGGPENLVVGRFRLRLFGKPRFVGYFSLSRIATSPASTGWRG